jgi:uncharacterized protein YegL
VDDPYLLRQADLTENPTARVPICLVLDVSGSMDGEPIRELNAGVRLFFDAIRADDVAQYAAEICIVTFGNVVTKELDFMSVELQQVPTLSASGATPMGAAVWLALDLLDARKGDYKRAGVDYFQPWMVLMTDGVPTDDISAAAARIRELVTEKKLTVFSIAIGDEAKLQTLTTLSPARPPRRLLGLNFREFFTWLSQSVSRVSQSTPGESVKLDELGTKSWGEV